MNTAELIKHYDLREAKEYSFAFGYDFRCFETSPVAPFFNPFAITLKFTGRIHRFPPNSQNSFNILLADQFLVRNFFSKGA